MSSKSKIGFLHINRVTQSLCSGILVGHLRSMIESLLERRLGGKLNGGFIHFFFEILLNVLG